MNTYPVIPTRGRPDAAVAQAERLLPQLEDREFVCMVVDGCEDTAEALRKVEDDRLHVTVLAENRGVNRARQIGTSEVPPDGIVVEIDDHDPAADNLLDAIREHFGSNDTILAYCDVYHTDSGHNVQRLVEKPDNEDFSRTGQLALGMRAYRKWAYDAVGGYPLQWQPAGDYALCCMLEQFGGRERVRRIAEPLVTVVEDAHGLTNGLRDDQQSHVSEISAIARRGGFELPYELHGRTPDTDATSAMLGCVDAESKPTASGASRPTLLVIERHAGREAGGGHMSRCALMQRLLSEGWAVRVAHSGDCGTLPDGITSVRAASLNPEHLSHVIQDTQPAIVLTGQRWAETVVTACHALNVPVAVDVRFFTGLISDLMDVGLWNVIDTGNVPEDRVQATGVTALQSADVVLANSDYTASVLRLLGIETDAIAYPPVQPVQAQNGNREYVLMVSGQRGKGTDTFRAIAEELDSERFVLLAGDVDAAPDMPGNVDVRTEWVEDMDAVYTDAACLVHPTHTTETYGRGIAEALAHGVPVCATDTGCIAHMVDPEHGCLIQRDAPLGMWCSGVLECLHMDCEPDDRWVGREPVAAIHALQTHRHYPETYYMTPHSAAGIRASVDEYEQQLGFTRTDWPKAEIPTDGVLICPAEWQPGLEEHAGPVVLHFHSHLAQMDSSRHEVTALNSALDESDARGNVWLALAANPDAQLLAKSHSRVIWLPVLVPEIKAPAASPYSGQHVFLPGPYGERKNIYVAMAAAATVADVVHVTDWIKKHKAANVVELGRRLGADVQVHRCESVDDVITLASRCSVAVQSSFAETFSYSAAQCIQAGTPVVGWAGIPAVGGSGDCFAQPYDPLDVAEALRKVMTDPREHVEQQQRELADIAEGRTNAIREALEVVQCN